MLRKTFLVGAIALMCAGQSVLAEENDAITLTVGDVIDKPGVLSPKGTWSLETSLSVTQNSSNKISVVGYTVLPTLIIGRIEVSDADFITSTFGLTARYGLSNASEIELRIPYVYRDDDITVQGIDDGTPLEDGDIVNRSVDGGDLGDIEFAFRHQFNFESAPYWLGGLRVKSDTGESPYEVDILDDVSTGSGFWSIEPSVTMLYPTDPAVLFASLGYIFNIEDSVDIGDQKVDLKLGDTVSVGGGMGFAVNPDLSFTLGVNHRTILKSEQDGKDVPNAKLLHLSSFTFGINHRINERSSLNVSAQAGLSEDAPDFQLNVRVPFYF